MLWNSLKTSRSFVRSFVRLIKFLSHESICTSKQENRVHIFFNVFFVSNLWFFKREWSSEAMLVWMQPHRATFWMRVSLSEKKKRSRHSKRSKERELSNAKRCDSFESENANIHEISKLFLSVLSNAVSSSSLSSSFLFVSFSFFYWLKRMHTQRSWWPPPHYDFLERNLFCFVFCLLEFVAIFLCFVLILHSLNLWFLCIIFVLFSLRRTKSMIIVLDSITTKKKTTFSLNERRTKKPTNRPVCVYCLKLFSCDRK